MVELDPRRGRQPGLGEQALAEDLVHAQSRRSGVTTHVGQIEHLEEPLNRAVFAVGPVEDSEGDVHRAIEEARVEPVAALEMHDGVGSIG